MLSLKILKPVTIIGQEYKIGDTVAVHKTLIHREVEQVSSGIKALLAASLIEAVSGKANTYKVLGDIIVNVVGLEYKKGQEFVSSSVYDYVDEVDYPAWIGKGVVDGLWSLEGDDVQATGVSIDKATFSIEEAATIQLAAIITPAGADTAGVWASSDASVATVDQTGLVTAVKAGTADITFTSVDGAVGTSAGTVTIKVILPTGATVSPTSPTVAVGATVQLNANVSPAGATDKTGVWSTADAAIATVDQNGLVTGVAAGTVAITFTTNSGGKKGNRNVTVS